MTWTPIVINGVLMTSHPEQRPDEVLLGNHSLEEFSELLQPSKRHGQVAYGDGGRVITDMVPVFVSESEQNLCLSERTVEIGRL